jgi:hypothetical protein
MASRQQSDNSFPVDSPPPVLRLRLVPWDVACGVAGLVALLVLLITTHWGTSLYGFLKDVCTGDECPPVPFGIDFYIYPVVWGGIGAAIAAAVVGPVVSLLRGWYLFFWPLLAMACIAISVVAGSILTSFAANSGLDIDSVESAAPSWTPDRPACSQGEKSAENSPWLHARW